MNASLTPFRAVAAALLLAVLATPSLDARPRLTYPQPFQPELELTNHQGAVFWPESVRRVVVLPIHDTTSRLPGFTLEDLDRVWLAAWQEKERAEIVGLSRPQLDRWLRQPSFDSTNPLPATWRARLIAATGAQAAVFVDLLDLEPYGSPMIAFRIKVVALDDARLIWISDETVDSRHPAVASSLRRLAAHVGGPGDGQIAAIHQRPSRFAAFAFRETLAQLPLHRPVKSP